MRALETFPDIPRVDGGVVVLRAACDADAAAMAEGLRDARVQRYIPGAPADATEQSLRRYIREGVPAYWAGGSAAVFAVADPASDAFLGIAMLTLPRQLPDIGEAVLWLSPAGRGLRRATAALRTLCRFGFEELQLARIEAFTAVSNRAMRLVGSYAGFSTEGVARARLLDPSTGRREDAIFAGMLPGDLQP
ncbi:GNAT family N-acetyltransferase [Kitasatospora cinereorecta]|uniref:GNAT family N-acetyltransferase n=1 Tax=Kitasatospora cinereorecta TaxID=285560 RepID=A0ABW0V7G0_9ACTN